MASICTEPNGRVRLVLKNPSGQRKTVRLGKISAKEAEAFRFRVEALITAKTLGQPLDLQTATWVAGLSKIMHDRLSAAGLVDRRTVHSVGDLVAEVRKSISAKKDSTRANFEQCFGNLLTFFGGAKHLADVTEADAEAFRSWLKESGRRDGRPLATATVSRRSRRVKQIFAFAIKKRWLASSPFREMKGWNEVNRKRQFVVTRKIAASILDAIPDAEFRVLFVFARYCGMRCPSEVRPFTWEQVNWQDSSLLIRIPKTEHHEDMDERLMPIFPDARPYLEELWEQADHGQPLLFPSYQITGTGITNKLERICRSIGIAMWPKPWVNMRSTCESELLNKHPIHKVAQWLGHSPTIALRHYAQIVKEQDVQDAGAARTEKLPR